MAKYRRIGNVIKITHKYIKIKNNKEECRCLHGKCITSMCMLVEIGYSFKPRVVTKPVRQAKK